MRVHRFAFGLALVASSCAAVAKPHHELEATLDVPFQSADGLAREFVVRGELHGGPAGSVLFGRVTVRDPGGVVVSVQDLEQPLAVAARTSLPVRWPASADALKVAPAPGFYTATLEAIALEPEPAAQLGAENRVDQALAQSRHVVVQEWDFQVGDMPLPAVPTFSGFVRPGQSNVSKGASGFTVYLGNLHSQTNHSDGGGNVATCSSSQGAQTGQYGPVDGFTFAQLHGLDFLAITDHNHYYDGSSGTNGSASPATVTALFQSGLQAAAQFAVQHPGFVPMYGMEWGVISNGGHMNVFGAQQLWGWEYNSSNQLLADVFTPKSDYAAIYSTMHTAGVLGQFNHPDSSGQFVIGGVSLAYTANGDDVMVLGEVANSSAFSNKTDESETSQSSFQTAFNRLLESGFHIAPSSNQDNHCANWGASAPNRTAVLIPNGTPLSQASLFEALQARRVFATTDKTSQILLTANGHMMGERFTNSGPLSLSVSFASSSGAVVSRVQIFEGVPQRNGTVTQLVDGASITTTPALGAHFYYGKITLASGKLLWSAPLWVTQDDVAPVVDPVFASGFE